MLDSQAIAIHRGVRLDTNEWEYGNLVVNGGRAFILSDENAAKMRRFESDGLSILYLVEVDIDTVGACSGVASVDFEPVYVGDILQTVTFDEDNNSPFRSVYRGEVVFSGGNFFADADENLETYDFQYCRIIGNVYENPELVE